MKTKEEYLQALRSVKRTLITAYNEITGAVDSMAPCLTAGSGQPPANEYGAVCQILGILEEQITSIGNQITKLKK